MYIYGVRLMVKNRKLGRFFSGIGVNTCGEEQVVENQICYKGT